LAVFIKSPQTAKLSLIEVYLERMLRPLS